MSSAYLLVHPETFPSVEPHNFPDGFELEGVDALYGAVLTAEASAYDRRIVILDSIAADEFDDGWLGFFQQGVTPDGWEVLIADPRELGRMHIPGLDGLTDVTLAGFNRYDCVRRVAARLRRRGLQVRLHEPCTLPLTFQAAELLAAAAREDTVTA